jgi:hypothetical protein
MMTPPAYSSLASPPRSPVNVLAHVFGVGGTGDGIDFARAGGTLGLVSGSIGFIGGIIAIVSGMLGVIGGALGIVSSGLLGIVAGGVFGVVLGGAVGTIGTSISLAASGLMATPSWRIMRVASGLMPRAAGSRWFEEAESFLSEAPAELRRRAIRNYLLTAPQVIVMSWIRALARRTGPPAATEGNDNGDSRS